MTNQRMLGSELNPLQDPKKFSVKKQQQKRLKNQSQENSPDFKGKFSGSLNTSQRDLVIDNQKQRTLTSSVSLPHIKVRMSFSKVNVAL